MFYGCLIGCSRTFNEVFMVFLGSLKGDKRKFQACVKEVSEVCYEHFKGVSEVF